jgi:hypothetical protein
MYRARHARLWPFICPDHPRSLCPEIGAKLSVGEETLAVKVVSTPHDEF